MHKHLPLVVSAALALAGCVDRPPASQLDITNPAAIDIRPAPEVRFAVARVSPALVRIDVWTETFSRGVPIPQHSLGSGVIIDAEGHVLTNFHVAGRARKSVDAAGVSHRTVDVTLANLEHVKAEVIGSDHWTDIAVVKLDLDELKRRNLTFSWAPMGDSAEVTLGQTVMALGTPYGLSRTVTSGIVSNTERYIDESNIGGYETGWFNNWIQTDAAINPGNSGGPLINLRGEVVGINTRAINDGNNLGFAIPINTAKEVVEKILTAKKVSRSYTGVLLQPMQDLETYFDLPAGGALIKSVEKDSPAAIAGVKGQDILLAVDGIPVNARFPEQLAAVHKLIADHPIGTTIKLTVRRGTSASAPKTTYDVTTDRLESIVAEEQTNKTWGLSVRDVTRAYLRDVRLPMLKGVLVTGVTSSLPGDLAKIQPDDIIMSVAGKPVTNVDEFEEAVAAWKKAPATIKVVVRRDRNEMDCILKPTE
jgi:serine protease Do